MLMNVEVQKCRLQIAKSVNDKKDSFFLLNKNFNYGKFSNEGSVLFARESQSKQMWLNIQLEKVFFYQTQCLPKKGCFHFVVRLRTCENLIIIAMTLKNHSTILEHGILFSNGFISYIVRNKKIV